MSRSRSSLSLFVGLVFALAVSVSCDKDTVQGIVDDIDAIAALKNVSFEYDRSSIEIILPDDALNGPSFSALTARDPELYGDPSHYGIELKIHYNADNTREKARDAKFDGINQLVVLSDLEETPINLTTAAFELKKGQTLGVFTQGAIDVATHRLAGLYIFRQMVDGNPLETRILTELRYKIGAEEGTISLLPLRQDIPTRASDEMKAFLGELLESGIFDQP